MFEKCRICEVTFKKIWYWAIVIYWTRFWKEVGILPRTVHKEPGTILWSTCYWNLQKVDILLSVQRLHFPGVFSRAKKEENCLFTSLQIKTQLIHYRITLSVNEFSVYGAVAAVCEEFEGYLDRTEKRVERATSISLVFWCQKHVQCRKTDCVQSPKPRNGR